jgi:hypothetical protein
MINGRQMIYVNEVLQTKYLKRKTVKLGYEELRYNELGYNEHSVIMSKQRPLFPGPKGGRYTQV